jgi:hypothetical protein
MAFDINLFLGISGWIFGVIALYLALKEHFEKTRIQRTLEDLKRSEFTDNLKKTASAILPNIPEFDIQAAIQQTAEKYLIDYLKSTTIGDAAPVLDVWEKAANDIGSILERNAKAANPSLPSGLAECTTFLLITHYSPSRGRAYLNAKTEANKVLEGNFARYYVALRNSPSNLNKLIDAVAACSDDEIAVSLAALKGEELRRVIELLDSQKWNRRMVERMREYLRVRQMSYNSLATKVLETSPLPKLFILFKNEGVEGSEEEVGRGRVVQNTLHDLKKEGKVELISPLAPVYFIRDSQTVDYVLAKLPEGEANNYVVFTGALDPLAINIKTSDRLEGRPAMLYENLVKFRNQQEVYASILLKLGVKPSDIIEKADIGFLIEPKSEKLSKALRANSVDVMKKLSIFTSRNMEILTDFRDLDEDDIGYLGTLLAEIAQLSQTEGRKLAEQISKESKELYTALYEPLP